MVTLREIARQSGVSVNTVSRALNGKLSESWPKVAERAEAIRKLARELGYRPNAAAQAMRNQKTNNIGVIMSCGFTFEYEVPVLIGLGQVLRREGYTLTLIDAQDCAEGHLQDVPSFREGFLDAVFIEQVPDYLRDYAKSICSRHIFLDSNVRKKTDCIYRDEYASGLLAAQETAALGHKKILFLTHPLIEGGHVNVTLRREGCEAGCRDSGCTFRFLEVGFSPEQRQQGEKELLDILQEYRAIVATGQAQAQWCANVLSQHWLCAGRDYSLCSCEEKLGCETVWPGLSRVSFDRVALGAQAARMMLDKLTRSKPHKCNSVVLEGGWIGGMTACRADALC